MSCVVNTISVRVSIQPVATHSADSVDIKVNVLDSWSLYADAMGSLNEGTVRVFERNFLGLGHQISGRYSQEIRGKTRPSFGLTMRFLIYMLLHSPHR